MNSKSKRSSHLESLNPLEIRARCSHLVGCEIDQQAVETSEIDTVYSDERASVETLKLR
jgi:hypothetical protein